eukprot:IDg4356t1
MKYGICPSGGRERSGRGGERECRSLREREIYYNRKRDVTRRASHRESGDAGRCRPSWGVYHTSTAVGALEAHEAPSMRTIETVSISAACPNTAISYGSAARAWHTAAASTCAGVGVLRKADREIAGPTPGGTRRSRSDAARVRRREG